MYQDPSMWGAPQLTPEQFTTLFVLLIGSSLMISLIYAAFWFCERYLIPKGGDNDNGTIHDSDSEPGGDDT